MLAIAQTSQLPISMQDAAPLALLAVGVALIAFSFLAGRRKGLRLADWLAPSRRGARSGARAEDRAELEATVRDVRALAEELARMTDERAERLQALIAAADERISALGSPAKPAARSAGALRERLAALRAETEPDSGPTPIGAAMPTDPLTRRIYELADGGASAREIATRLDEPIGKVELILALRSAPVR